MSNLLSCFIIVLEIHKVGKMIRIKEVKKHLLKIQNLNILNINIFASGSCSNFWIGGSSTTPGSNYVSVRGDPIPNNFIFWSPTQPDPAGGTESCLEMRKNFNNYLMNDFVCSVTQGFICQKFV
ncbi:hypothetical protein ACJMK2_038923 [Sinanodonta woodiana]|uniref:C-type lectin domain-containing protein n=1 Tax=Sinanodonta woodiana TaxID=1069815 RepID=A0ABD3WDU3_SINWO